MPALETALTWLVLVVQTPADPQTLEPDPETQALLAEEIRQAPQINPNRARPSDLLQLPFISEDLALRIYLEAQKKPFRDFQDLAHRVPLTPLERWVLSQTLVFGPPPPQWRSRVWLRWQTESDDTLWASPEGWAWVQYRDRVRVGGTWPEARWVVGLPGPRVQVWLGTLEPQFGLGLLDPEAVSYALRWSPRPAQRFRLLRGASRAVGVAWRSDRSRSVWGYASGPQDLAFRFQWRNFAWNLASQGVTAEVQGSHGPVRLAVEAGLVHRKVRVLGVVRARTQNGQVQVGAGNTGTFAGSVTYRIAPGWSLSSDQVLDDGYRRVRSGLTIRGRAPDAPVDLQIRHTVSGPLGAVSRRTLSLRVRWNPGIRQAWGWTHVTSEAGPGDLVWLGGRWAGLEARVAVFRAPDWASRIYWMEPEPGTYPRWRTLYGTGRLALVVFQTVLWQSRFLLKWVGIQKDATTTWEFRVVVYHR